MIKCTFRWMGIIATLSLQITSITFFLRAATIHHKHSLIIDIIPINIDGATGGGNNRNNEQQAIIYYRIPMIDFKRRWVSSPKTPLSRSSFDDEPALLLMSVANSQMSRLIASGLVQSLTVVVPDGGFRVPRITYSHSTYIYFDFLRPLKCSSTTI